MKRNRQALYPNYRSRLCHYCGGRGFTLIEQVDPGNPDKMIWNNVVIECKFCAGQGIIASHKGPPDC